MSFFVSAVPTGGAGWGRDQPDALVVPYRLNVYAGVGSKLSDQHGTRFFALHL
jgi:hypothetical protein